MKKIILASIVLISFCGHAFSQISKDSLVKLMAKDMCTEISKQDLSNKKIENFEMELGMAMMPLFTKYGKEIKEIYGFDIEDGGNAETVGKDIGMRLAIDCPAFLKLIMQSPEVLKSASEKIDKTDQKIKGTLIKINASDITYLDIKTATGKVEKLYWLEYFEGSNYLKSPSVVNKKMSITYDEKEVYKASLKEYVKIKIITSLTLE